MRTAIVSPDLGIRKEYYFLRAFANISDLNEMLIKIAKK